MSERSTRPAATRCIRCGNLARAIVVNIPVGRAEPVDIECGWVDPRACAAWQATQRQGEGER